MNLEITSKIQVDQYYTFSFNKKVNQFMVGFSSFNIKFDNDSHHVKEITIDLTHTTKNGNTITVEPKIIMNDTSGNKISNDSSIEVVLASTGDGNQNIYMQIAVEDKIQQEHPLENIKFIQSAIYSTSVQYEQKDHHLENYFSHITVTELSPNSYKLDSQVRIKDQSGNCGEGKMKGSVIAFNGDTKNVLCGCFPNNNNNPGNNNSTKVKLATLFRGFQHSEYSFCYFISSFDLSYPNGKDHHIKEIDLSIQKSNPNLIEEENNIYAVLSFKANLKDKSHNSTDIPHNKISGFVIAIKNQSINDNSDYVEMTKKSSN